MLAACLLFTSAVTVEWGASCVLARNPYSCQGAGLQWGGGGFVKMAVALPLSRGLLNSAYVSDTKYMKISEKSPQWGMKLSIRSPNQVSSRLMANIQLCWPSRTFSVWGILFLSCDGVCLRSSKTRRCKLTTAPKLGCLHQTSLQFRLCCSELSLVQCLTRPCKSSSSWTLMFVVEEPHWSVCGRWKIRFVALSGASEVWGLKLGAERLLGSRQDFLGCWKGFTSPSEGI